MDNAYFKDQLCALLRTYNEAAFRVQQAANAERLHSAAEIYIFGAGQNGQMVASRLADLGLLVSGYLDETPSKQNTTLNDIPVLPLGFLGEQSNSIVIVSIFSPEIGFAQISARLKTHTRSVISLFEFLWMTDSDGSASFYFLNHPSFLHRHVEDIMWFCDRLADEQSLHQLCAHVRFRQTLNYDVLPPAKRIFWPDAVPFTQIAYIDCGAYDGDTLIPFMRKYSDQTRLALPFEPDPQNYARLERNIAALDPNVRQKIVPIAAATGHEGTNRMFNTGKNQASALSNSGSVEVEVKALDDVIDQYCKSGDHIIIKIDVEGADLETLKGAKRSIIEREPWLAISAYHTPSDLWSLPQYVARLNHNYRFALRSNGADGADLMIYAFVPR
jgi:FkbM family methyltransferase